MGELMWGTPYASGLLAGQGPLGRASCLMDRHNSGHGLFLQVQPQVNDLCAYCSTCMRK